MFLDELDELMVRIDNAISSDTAYIHSIIARDLPATQALEITLAQLKEALMDMDISSIDQTVDSLLVSAYADNENALIKKISKHILMGEYDEAIGIIESATQQTTLASN